MVKYPLPPHKVRVVQYLQTVIYYVNFSYEEKTKCFELYDQQQLIFTAFVTNHSGNE